MKKKKVFLYLKDIIFIIITNERHRSEVDFGI
jgi:hypothetical protein